MSEKQDQGWSAYPTAYRL